jgi:hypothetical protein
MCSYGWIVFTVLTVLGSQLATTTSFKELSIPQVVLEWKPYTPKYLSPSNYNEYNPMECHVTVPADHFATVLASIGQSITLRVRRFTPKLSHPSKQVWIVPGGPGGHSNLVEASIGRYIKMSRFMPDGGKDIEWLFMDHRGTGQSSKLASSKISSKEFWTLKASQSKIPLQCYSPQNASMDLITLASAQKRQSRYSHGVRVYGIGASYGTFVLDTAAQIEPLIFDGLMFDGYTGGVISIEGADIGNHLQNICAMNKECRMLVNDIDGVSSLMSRLQQTRNSCIQSMMQWSSPNAIIFGHTSSLLRSFVKNIMECPDLPAEKRAATLLALLTHSETCLHPGAFSRALNHLQACKQENPSKMLMMLSGDLDVSHKAQNNVDLPLKDANKCAPSAALYSVCFWSARVALEKRLTKQQLPVVSPGAFVSELDRLHQLPAKPPSYLLSYLHQPLTLPQYGQNIKRVQAKSIVVLASKLDTQTLHDESLNLLKHRISSKVFDAQNASFFSLDYAKHVSLLTSGCAIQLFALLIDRTEDSQQKAKECVKNFNARIISYLALDDQVKVLWSAQKILALDGKLMPNMLALISDEHDMSASDPQSQKPNNQAWFRSEWITSCGMFVLIGYSLPIVHFLIISIFGRKARQYNS